VHMYYCPALVGTWGRSRDKWYSIATDGRGQVEVRWENRNGAVDNSGAALPASGGLLRDYSEGFGSHAADHARQDAETIAAKKQKKGYVICELVEPAAAAAAAAAAI
jgi:hypothetical protein